MCTTHILLRCWWMCTLPTKHTRTYAQQYSIIKPVSQPHRKQSLLYVTEMSLILAEVNKCTCMEGIFHRQTADNGAIVALGCSTALCIQSGPFGWLRIHCSCQGLCFMSQMNVFMWEKTCETRSKINVPAVYLFLLQETTIYFSEWGENKCIRPFFKVWPCCY